MSSQKVLDSYAFITLLENELGADTVAALIKTARDLQKPLLMTVVNWGEIYYILKRESGEKVAQSVMEAMDTLPIDIVPVDKEITKAAAEFKASKKMSYADCFAAALAKLKKADLVTGDKEFKEVQGEVKVVWLS